MSRANLFIFSIIGGAFITITLTWTAFSIDNKKLSRVLLWQDTIFLYLVGPGPLLGHDAQGSPIEYAVAFGDVALDANEGKTPTC